MTTRTCTQCGHPLPEQAQFCGQCGALTPALCPHTRTMMHVRRRRRPAPAGREPATPVDRRGPGSARRQPAPPQPAAPSGGAAQPDFKRTMLGFGAAVPAPRPPAPPGRRGARRPRPRPPAGARPTMRSAARPGSGLGATGHGLAGRSMRVPAPPAARQPPKARREQDDARASPSPGSRRSVPGEAHSRARRRRRCGIASRSRAGSTLPCPAVLPAPAPIADLPAPPPPRIVRKRRSPSRGRRARRGRALVVVGGAAIAYFWHGAPPITATPRVTPEGTDVLHLTCDAGELQGRHGRHGRRRVGDVRGGRRRLAARAGPSRRAERAVASRRPAGHGPRRGHRAHACPSPTASART